MKSRIILDLCGGTASFSRPYADAGYLVYNITLPEYDVTKAVIEDQFVRFPRKGGGAITVRKNAVHGILAAPPCTEFSIAKDHTLERDLKGGMRIVNACKRIIDACEPEWWVIENPVGYLRDFLGEPAYSFQPWWFGSPWSKRTFLWGRFNKPVRTHKSWAEVNKIRELYIRPGRGKPSIAFLHKSAQQYIPELWPFKISDDAAFRAITSPRFAAAFFKANS